MILLRCLFALTSAQRRESPSGRYKWKFRFLRSLGYIGASRANRPRRFIGRIYTYVERSLSFFRLLFRTFSVPANSLHDGEQEDEAPVNESVQSLGAQSHHASFYTEKEGEDREFRVRVENALLRIRRDVPYDRIVLIETILANDRNTRRPSQG